MAIDFNDRLRWRKQQLDYSALSNAELCAVVPDYYDWRDRDDEDENLRVNWKLMAVQQVADDEARRRIVRGQFSLLRTFKHVGRSVYIAGESKDDATHDRLERALIELNAIMWEFVIHRCADCGDEHHTGQKRPKHRVHRKKVSGSR